MKKIISLTFALVASIIMFAAEGGLNGRFAVNEQGKQVVFAKGNLQYQASTGTWQFAANQYDVIGMDNWKISDSYDGWIDLFGFGTGDNPTKVSEDAEDYAIFTDWGVNAISNGGDKANLWRTLTKAEWEFIIYDRTNAENYKSQATVNGVNGVVLLPDAWKKPSGVNYVGNALDWTSNVFTADQWETMQKAGAVFLPIGMSRLGNKIDTENKEVGHFWTSTPDNENSAWSADIVDGYSLYSYCFSRQSGACVRLVSEDLTTGLSDMAGKGAKEAKKVIRDGQILIVRDGVVYNILGAEVK